MKKNYLLLTVLLIANSLFAQIPAGYYDSATGTGFTLKTQLKRIIDNNNDGLSPEYQSVQLSYGDLYNTYELSDVDIDLEIFLHNPEIAQLIKEKVNHYQDIVGQK